MDSILFIRTLVLVLMMLSSQAWISSAVAQTDTLLIPKLLDTPAIDGDLSDWKLSAHHDGLWDIFRLRNSPWYSPVRNRLTQHEETSGLIGDLTARYYTAWDDEYLYLGAEVWDNRNDTISHRDGPQRWYDKDGVSWFVEAPADDINERFGQGDNSYCIIADPNRPSNGAWWRHGNPDSTYIEVPVPKEAIEYVVKLNPWDRSEGDYIIEAKVHMASTMAKSDPNWQAPKEGHVYRLMIVHCDPDGGPYGGHFLMYGTGDDDLTWYPAKLSGPIQPPKRKVK